VFDALSGTNNGTISFSVTYTAFEDPHLDFIAGVKLLGTGRYAN